jgi:hypothetical protein
MSDAKSHQFRPPLYRRSSGDGSNGGQPGSGTRNEQQGWEAYRKWLSSVNGKAKAERVPLDHSIYSWKGYQNWADRVRQTWKSDDN